MNVHTLVRHAIREDTARRIEEEQRVVEDTAASRLAALQARVDELTGDLEEVRLALAQVREQADAFKNQHRDAMAALMAAQAANAELLTRQERLAAQVAGEREARVRAEAGLVLADRRVSDIELNLERERSARQQERAQQLPLPVTYNSPPPPLPKSWTIVVSKRDGADRVRELKVSAGED